MKEYTELNENELMEMANMTKRTTGIEKVIIWAGPNPHSDVHRIKVCNKPHFLGNGDLFTLTIPEYKIYGRVNEELISPEVMREIKSWCDKNRKAIIDYSEFRTSTGEDSVQKSV